MLNALDAMIEGTEPPHSILNHETYQWAQSRKEPEERLEEVIYDYYMERGS